MKLTSTPSPTPTPTLRALVRKQMAKIARHQEVIAQHELIIARRDHEIAYKTAKIDKLTHERTRLRRVPFSVRSERMNPEQRELFDEAMAADIAAVEAALEALQASPPAASAKSPRAKPVHHPLPPEPPREITVHTPERCDCATCGSVLTQIGTHASEKLDVKPPVFFVRRDEYPQFVCPRCETIVAEPVAPALIDRGQVAPGLLAQVAIQKYADHLPLYRQEAVFARHGITLARTRWPNGWVMLAFDCSLWSTRYAPDCLPPRYCTPTKPPSPSSIRAGQSQTCLSVCLTKSGSADYRDLRLPRLAGRQTCSRLPG